MEFLSRSFFWLVLTAVATLLLLVAPAIAWCVRWISERRKDPLVIVHYWWEEVIDYGKLWMSPFVTVGTLRPVYRGLANSLSGKVSMATHMKHLRPEQIELWIRYPVYRLGKYQQVSVYVLRVMIFNQSRRRPVYQETFGTLRIEIANGAGHIHGWSRALLGGSAETGLDDEYGSGTARVHLRLPRPLDLRDKVRDDLTITQSFTGPSQSVVDVRTTSVMRLRLKPWQPSITRPWYSVPNRVVRWLRLSRRPKLFVETPGARKD